VPFIARGPGIPAGAVCQVPVAGYDFLPTFYDLAGGKEALPNEIDGCSIKPLLVNPALPEIDRPHGALFFHRPAGKFSAIRQGEYKLMIYWTPKDEIQSTTLVRFDPNPREEGRDISAEEPEKTAELREKLLAYLKSVNAETLQGMPKKRKGKNAKAAEEEE